MNDILNITNGVEYDDTITKIEYHTYSPFLASFNNSDEIRISIQHQDLNILPCESFICIEGKFVKADDTVSTTAKLVNNCICQLLEEVRYELNGLEIDKNRDVGNTSTLKNYISLNENESKMLLNAGWSPENNIQHHNGNFNFCIPLKMLLGFAEDYKKIIVKAKHELILIRSRTDLNAIISSTDDIKFKIGKIQWKVPHVMISDEQKLALYKYIESGSSIQISFRSWDMHEYPILPTTTHHVWTVKTSTQLEKPRFIIFAMQTNRTNKKEKDASKFDHCNLSDIKLFLNSESFPYDQLNLDIPSNKYALLYDMYAKFQQSYYAKQNQPLLTTEQFKNMAPITVLDCSHQAENIKNGPVDVRLEFKCLQNIPDNTSAFCLILHDRVVEYNPITNEVKKY